MKTKPLDIPMLIDCLGMMIRMADALAANGSGYSPVMKKLRKIAYCEHSAAVATLHEASIHSMES
jgi:hypothetical protein